MRLIRLVAVACMVAVSVASLGCSETETTVTKKDADKPAASTTESSAETPEASATEEGVTQVSLTIGNMK